MRSILFICLLVLLFIAYIFTPTVVTPPPLHRQNEIEIVISYYNENLDWIIPYKNITILYNKGQPIDGVGFKRIVQTLNVGREAYVYLYHIVMNYHNLANLTIFYQGDAYTAHAAYTYPTPDDYIRRYREDTVSARCITPSLDKRGDVWGRIKHCCKWLEELKSGKLRRAKGDMTEFWNDIFAQQQQQHPPCIDMWYAGIMAVTKQAIRNHPVEWYDYILTTYLSDHTNPEEAHYMEHLWYTIFTRKNSLTVV